MSIWVSKEPYRSDELIYGGNEPLELKKMKQKMQKNEMSIFPLYFWTNAFVKKTTLLDTVPGHGF